ncbi:MAG TPA: hypothetical protein VMS35_01470 [Nitrososphaeraceae archaeon]|nr:hypothetical protein [Nitrososphaeraceae archaeon]
MWLATEPVHKIVFGISISEHRNMLVAEKFYRSLVEIYGTTQRTQMEVYGIQRHAM